MQIKELKNYFFSILEGIYEPAELDSIFYILTSYLYGLKRIDVSLQPEFEISLHEMERWNSILIDLKNEKPIQYITGEAWFYGLRLEVNQATLIPRPETEELVEWIIESQTRNIESQTSTILDVGTGSGCIPISLKANLPKAKVYAVDVSDLALATARKNAIENHVVVDFLQADILDVGILEYFKDSFIADTLFDVIVSNPPYVRHLEKVEIKKNVLDYEPHLALFVEDNDALLFYRVIAKLAMQLLKPGGCLFFEINQYLGPETIALLRNLGFHTIELRKDFAGNDRMIRCSIQ